MENDSWWKNISLESGDGEPKTKVNEEILAAVMCEGTHRQLAVPFESTLSWPTCVLCRWGGQVDFDPCVLRGYLHSRIHPHHWFVLLPTYSWPQLWVSYTFHTETEDSYKNRLLVNGHDVPMVRVAVFSCLTPNVLRLTHLLCAGHCGRALRGRV